VPIQINHLLEARGELAKVDFKKCWNQTKVAKVYPPAPVTSRLRNVDSFAKFLRENNMFVVQKKKSEEETLLYISCRAANNKLNYLCLAIASGMVEIEVRSEDSEVLDLLYQGILFLSNS